MRPLILFFLLFLLSCNFLKEAPFFSEPKFAFLDYSNMIPIRTTGMYHQFEMSLTGSAIKGNTPFNIHFDTGSFSTTIPYSAIDKTKITVIQKNTRDNWGQNADLVAGQLCVKGADKKTDYCIDDFKFYAIESGRIIMGAFPRDRRAAASFPYALAKKYAKGKEGFGIFSEGGGGDMAKDWHSTKCYLQLGPYPNIENKLNWRSDIPNLGGGTEFSPDAIPGYTIIIKIPDSDKKIITGPVMATIDTGAPDMTLRLGKTDPQNKPPFDEHFVKDGPWKHWGNAAYNASATSLINGIVTVDWEDDKGKVLSYSYLVGNNPTPSVPATLIAGEWNSPVPWDSKRPDTPKHRINLGNTIYFYCPVYYYDIKNKRIGIGFEHQPTKVDFPNMEIDKSTLIRGQQISGDKKLVSKNGKFQCRINEAGRLVVEEILSLNGNLKERWSPNIVNSDTSNNYLILQDTDGHLCLYTGENRFLWCADGSIRGHKLQLNDDGSLIVYNGAGGINWTSKN